jgi:ferredoxin
MCAAEEEALPKVRFEREDITIEAKPGQNLLRLAESAGISVFRGMWPDLHCDGPGGWCNRCKVWVKPLTEGAINPPTKTETSPFRLNGRVRGNQRLACQVTVNGDVVVHTRVGGPPVKPNMNWQASPEPSKWKERWENRKAGGSEKDEEEAADEA